MDIEWKEGSVFYTDNTQYRIINGNVECFTGCGWVGSAHAIDWLIERKNLQLNTIKQGDYIEASEIDTEQKYNDAVEVFELFGFSPYLNCDMDVAEFILTASKEGCGLIADSDGDLVIDYNYELGKLGKKRKLTYQQLMAIGKLKRAMIERDKLNAPEITDSSELKPSDFDVAFATSDWSDEHYNHFYQLTKEDVERGKIKVDAYFVNRMWKINSWEDTGAGFHILKTLPRIANNKNSLKRELVALKKQVDMLCKLHGVDDES